jgi:predicted Rossmann-fold nucleotide-binding protein
LVDDIPAIAMLGPERDPVSPDTLAMAASLGRALVAAGCGVIVSGGGPVATAAGRAALDSGGRVIAMVDVDGPTPEIGSGARVVTHASVFRRLEGVLEHADALIALPGGLTSLAALLQVWSFGDTLDGPYRPMVLVGEAWPPIVKALADAASLDRRTRAMVTFANTADEAVETLRYYVSARS